MLQHAPRPWLVAAAVLIVIGAVLLAVAGSGETLGIVGGAILSLGAIVGIGVAFYAVGRSEDVARERGED